MEYPNLSYQEMAERTGMHKESIRMIARELGLERTPEQYHTIRRAGPENEHKGG